MSHLYVRSYSLDEDIILLIDGILIYIDETNVILDVGGRLLLLYVTILKFIKILSVH